MSVDHERILVPWRELAHGSPRRTPGYAPALVQAAAKLDDAGMWLARSTLAKIRLEHPKLPPAQAIDTGYDPSQVRRGGCCDPPGV